MSDQMDIFGGYAEHRRTQRVRDEHFEALCSVCKINAQQMTVSQRKITNRALKEIRDAGGSPGDILHRSRAYVERFRHTPTPGALARHWAALEVRPHAARRIEPQTAENGAETLSRDDLAARARSWWDARGR